MENARIFLNRLIEEQSFKLLSKATLISITDTDGVIQYANQNFAEISGYSIEELIGQKHNIINSGYHPKSFWADMWRTIMEGKTWCEEVKNKAKDGTYYWVDTKNMPWADDNGKICAFLSIRNNITKKKEIEAEKNELNNKLNILTEHIPGFLYQYHLLNDGSSNFPYASTGIKNIYGVTPEEVRENATKVFQVIHPDDLEHVINSIRISAETLKEWRDEYRVILPSGETIWLGGYSSPQKMDDGSIVWHGYINNITERKKTAAEKEESEKRFHIMADSAPVLIWMSGTDKRCNYFNKVWHEFTGRTLEQGIGNAWSEGIHADDLDRCLEIYVGHFDQRKPFRMEYRLRRNDGQYRWILDQGVPRYLANGEFVGYIGSCIDITERVQAEMLLKKQNEQLREISWIQSHELRAPVANILGLINLYNNIDLADPDNKEIICNLKIAAQKLDGIIHKIVDKT